MMRVRRSYNEYQAIAVIITGLKPIGLQINSGIFGIEILAGGDN
jgi:hypothetical protein